MDYGYCCLPANRFCDAFTTCRHYTTSSIRSGSSSWPGVSGVVTLFSVGGSCEDTFRVLGACGFLLQSYPRLGRSLLGSSLHWAVEGPGRAATAAAAAAPAALLAAGGADPAEAMLPAGPAAGLRSHGEFTVVGTSSPVTVWCGGWLARSCSRRWGSWRIL